MTIKTDSYYTHYTIRLKSHLISVESYRILSRFHVINSSVIVIFKPSEFNHIYFFLYQLPDTRSILFHEPLGTFNDPMIGPEDYGAKPDGRSSKYFHARKQT